jgi:ABC-type transport system substrate-binding protein
LLGAAAAAAAAGLTISCSTSNNKPATKAAATSAAPTGGSPGAAPRAASSPSAQASDSNEYRLPGSHKIGDTVIVSPDTFFKTTGQKSGGTFRYSSQYGGGTFDPHLFQPGDFIMERLVYQPLYSGWREGQTTLWAADRLETPDVLTANFHVRDNLKFHPIPPVNGRAMTAADVKYSHDRAMGNSQSIFGKGVQGYIDSVQALDGNIAQIKYKLPYSGRFWADGIIIVAPEAAESLDLNTHAVGTGPYMIPGAYDSTARNTFQRHPDYVFSGRPFPDKLEYTIITDQAAHIAAFRADQADIINRDLPKALAQTIAKDANGTAQRVPTFTPEAMLVRSDKAAFTDPRVREAISKAVDRKELINKVSLGEGYAIGPIPWGMRAWALPQDEVDKFYNVNDFAASLKDAKALIAAAGGDSLPEIELSFYSDVPITANGASVIAQMLRNAGLKIKENGLPTTQVLTTKLYPGKFDLIYYRAGDAESGPAYLLTYGSKDVPGAAGYGGGTDAKIDAALKGIIAEQDLAALPAKVAEAQRTIMSAYINQIPFFDGWAYYVVKSRVKDFRAGGPTGNYFQNDFWLAS